MLGWHETALVVVGMKLITDSDVADDLRWMKASEALDRGTDAQTPRWYVIR